MAVAGAGVIRHLAMLPLDGDGIAVPGDYGRALGDDVLGVLRRYVQRDGDHEAGGVILGRYLDGCAIVADAATEPGPADIREPRNFHRLDDSHQEQINDAWHRSGGSLNYLGEWHTHSEPVPVPSAMDLGAWAGNWRDARATSGGDAPILGVIVGQTHIGVWEVGPCSS